MVAEVQSYLREEGRRKGKRIRFRGTCRGLCPRLERGVCVFYVTEFEGEGGGGGKAVWGRQIFGSLLKSYEKSQFLTSASCSQRERGKEGGGKSLSSCGLTETKSLTGKKKRGEEKSEDPFKLRDREKGRGEGKKKILPREDYQSDDVVNEGKKGPPSARGFLRIARPEKKKREKKATPKQSHRNRHSLNTSAI